LIKLTAVADKSGLQQG